MCHVLTNTLPRSSSKRYVSIRNDTVTVKTFRLELLRFSEVLWITVQTIQGDVDRSSSLDNDIRVRNLKYT